MPGFGGIPARIAFASPKATWQVGLPRRSGRHPWPVNRHGSGNRRECTQWLLPGHPGFQPSHQTFHRWRTPGTGADVFRRAGRRNAWLYPCRWQRTAVWSGSHQNVINTLSGLCQLVAECFGSLFWHGHSRSHRNRRIRAVSRFQV